MADLFRETVAGRLLRIFGLGRRLLPYPEELPDFEIPSSALTIPKITAWSSGQQSPVEKSSPASDNNTTQANSQHSYNEKATPASDSNVAYPQITNSDSRVQNDIESAAESHRTLVSEVKPATESAEYYIVGWYGEHDKDNPQNWTFGKKTFVLIQICGFTFAVYVGSSLIVSSLPDLMRIYNVGRTEVALTLSTFVFGYGAGAMFFSPLSEIPLFGRNPFYVAPLFVFLLLQVGVCLVDNFAGLSVLRLLTGLMGAPLLATGGATLVDMYAPMYIPIAFSVWVIFAFAGPSLGPVLGNFAVNSLGWRWSMWILLFAIGASFASALFLLPETSPSNILLRRAKRIRQVTGRHDVRSQSELDQATMTASKIAVESLLRPIQISILDPAILYVNVYISIVYAIYYLFFDAIPLVYTRDYQWAFASQGLAFICILVGGLLAMISYLAYIIFRMGPYIEKHGWPVQEMVLEMGCGAVVLAPIGLFIFAWTAKADIHWIGNNVGNAVYAASTFIILQTCFLYVVLSYPQYAASILAANDFCRSAAAAGMLHAGPAFFETLHVDGGVSFLAGICVLLCPGMWFIYRYGAKLRARSRFAVATTPQ